MYHPRLAGPHYSMGYKYGSLMKKNKVYLSEVVKLTHEKRQFGQRCIAVCRDVFPEAVEELQGLADGLELPLSEFGGWIFCIYCYEYKRGCTCIIFKDAGNIIFGRNSDFFTEIREVCESALYLPDRGYRFIGNSTAMVQMEDGFNEHGLAIGLTFIPSRKIKPGLNAGILLRYILEKCRTVKEALKALHLLPVSSSQTLTMIDKAGEMAVVECNCEKAVVTGPAESGNYLVSTNRFAAPEMLQYNGPDLDNSEERYRVACRALKANNHYSYELARNILSGKYGFMCQYESRKYGFDTLWSTIYDLKNDRVFRAEGNPSKARYKEDIRLRKAGQTANK